MADQIKTVLKHPSGKHLPVVVHGAARRDALLARGYSSVERSVPEPEAQPGQVRRTEPKAKAKKAKQKG